MKKSDKKLILFDIDGILVRTNGLAGTTVSIKKHFNLDASEINKKMYLEGKTYRACFAEKLEALGIKDPEKHEKFEIAIRDAEPIKDSIKNGGIIEKIKGVEKFLKKVISEGYVIGLLTGNSLESAKAKLEVVDLWKYFKFGAYGTETRVRAELVPLAIVEAEKCSNFKFPKKDIFIIGDTMQDIKCAKDSRVKIISIATGNESFELLKEHKPDFIFKDFSDTNKILKVIQNE